MQDLRKALTPEEKESIYRFRYRVFAEHLHRDDLDGLDREQQILTDEMDHVSTHFYLGEPAAPLAAVTVSPLHGEHVPPDLFDFLGVARLRQAVAAERIGFINWLLVDPAHAGSTAVPTLLSACYELLLQQGIELMLTFCRPGLVSFYERLGLEQYSHATNLKGLGLRCPIMLVMRDGSRLRACRSPFLRILLRNGGDEHADAVRLRIEPVIDLFQASQILANDDLWLESGAGFVERATPRLFDGIDEDSVRQIMKMASVISCRSGEVMTRQGETSDDMFLIVSGVFDARRGGDGRVRRLVEGDLFGEIEHLSGTARTETITAAADGHVAALKAERLFQWMQKNPEPGVRLATNLARLLAGRLSE